MIPTMTWQTHVWLPLHSRISKGWILYLIKGMKGFPYPRLSIDSNSFFLIFFYLCGGAD